MQTTLSSIEQALSIVQETLDLLTSRKDDETAFEVARAQYSASIRDSWPSNLSPLVKVLTKINENPATKLDEAERAQVSKAIELLQVALDL